MDREFPSVIWGDVPVTFRPCEPDYTWPQDAPTAALVFAFHEDRCVLADIPGRGWCIPGGRLEPCESAEAAARREAWEECGVELVGIEPLGDTIAKVSGSRGTILAAEFIAAVSRFDLIPAGFESRGMRLAARDELPDCYYMWDPLIEAVFDYAWERRRASNGA